MSKEPKVVAQAETKAALIAALIQSMTFEEVKELALSMSGTFSDYPEEFLKDNVWFADCLNIWAINFAESEK